MIEIAIIMMQWLDTSIKGSFPPEKGSLAYKLNCAISVMQVVLVVPYIFSQIIKLVMKIILWPADVYYYNGMCTFDYAEHQNDLLNK